MESTAPADVVNIVVLQAEDRQFGLVVDGINDTQEIVVKPLGKQLKGLTVYAGATIMGDGRVALILDVLGIGAALRRACRIRGAGARSARTNAQRSAEQQRLLLFRAGSFERLAVPLSWSPGSRSSRELDRACRRSPGGAVPRPHSPPGAAAEVLEICERLDRCSETADPVQVVVFNDGDRSVGVVVDQILDVVEAVTVRQKSTARDCSGRRWWASASRISWI